MIPQLKTVALHITNECSHSCPMCYATSDCQVKREGNIHKLKKISTIFKQAGVSEICLVGGDPAEYTKMLELLKHLKGELDLDVSILSNTHNYQGCSIEEVATNVFSLEATIHSPIPEKHDRFCGRENAYHNVISNLKIYDGVRTPEQKLGIVLNLMSHNNHQLSDTVESVLNQGIGVDYVLIQRIAPFYRGKFFQSSMTKEKIVLGMMEVDKINKKLGIETSFVDAFPYCLIPEEYHSYLTNCDWGYGTVACDMDGNLSRCAMSPEYKLGNVLYENVIDIWENDPSLKTFRAKKFLPEECHNCTYLGKCGGACSMSCGSEQHNVDILVKKRV